MESSRFPLLVQHSPHGQREGFCGERLLEERDSSCGNPPVENLVIGDDASNPDQVFYRASGVAADDDGTIYVLDSGSHRIQVFDAEGRFITKIIGDATLSKWGITKLDANPDMKRQREIAQGLEREKFLRGPIGVVVDDEDRVFIVDSQRNRIQIYRKIPPFFVGLYDGGRL